MNKGIIYLIQPAELVGTQRYKPGFSNSPTLKRFLGYKNGTRYLRIAEAIEAKKLETKILDEFRKKFKLIAGNEYFEGDEIAMIDMFDQEVRKHRNEYGRNPNDIEKELETLNEINLDLILDDTIKNHHIPKKFENNVNTKSARWVCDKCGQTFTRKEKLKYHIDNNSCKIKSFKCYYCDATFAASSNMHRHMRTSCKNKIAIDREKSEIYERLLKLESANSELEKSNAELKNQNTQMERDNVILKSQNNEKYVSMNNTYLFGYGKEDMSRIDKNDLNEAFESGINSTLTLIELIHFNPKYPEFHNVYISSMKNKYAMMYDGHDWILVMKDDLIDKIYDNKRDYIEENLGAFVNSLSQSQLTELCEYLDSDDHSCVKKIKNNIRLLLYNKRNLALNNKCLIGGSTECDNFLGEPEKHSSKNNIPNNTDNKSNMKVIKEPKIHIKYDSDSDSDSDSGSSNISVNIKRRAKTFAKGAGRPGTKRKSRKLVKSN